MGIPKITQQNPKGRKTGKIYPKSTGNSQNGPWKGPGKTGRALKGFPKVSRRVGKASRRVWKAFGGLKGHFLGSFGGFPAIWAGHLGHLVCASLEID